MLNNMLDDFSKYECASSQSFEPFSSIEEACGIDESPNTIELYDDWEHEVINILLNDFYTPRDSFLLKPDAAWAVAYIKDINPSKFAFDIFFRD